MDSKELRRKFLDFFEKRGHRIAASSSLVTADPTVLFTTAGMQQFKPYYLGEKSPYGDNVASCQRCLRVSDIEEVGDERHLTFFEMLGNFSFGGYFKEEAIKLAKEFLDSIGIKIDYITVFEGDEDTPRDQESVEIWKELGFSEEDGKLRFENKEENFWGPTGDEGPCGPTTEIYSDGIEIWNIVFNQYYSKKGKLEPLKVQGIDTGMGLERLAKVSQKTSTVFETDLFLPVIGKMEELSGKKYEDNKKEFRIIADHIKSSVFLLAEGVLPLNVERGYILRRLIRRAVRYAKLFKMPEDFSELLATEIIGIYESICPDLRKKQSDICLIMRQEQERFEKTLEKGLKEIEKISKLTGEAAFGIYETYGFPLEMAEEIKPVENREEFFRLLKEHQELSRTASAGMFKGGLADDGPETAKLHTAAHLMLAGLRKVLGEHVQQKGSNITSQRLRFDFSHKEKMTDEQIKDVENFVNGIIEKDLAVSCEEMPLEKAKELNATGVFESKYGQTVKVYTVGQGKEIVSREICGGPHAERTGILGKFKIVKEESSSAGVRRIKAILE